MAVSADIGRRRVQIFDRLLRIIPTGSLVDLGAGHGSFSVLAANAGWKTTAVDARDERFPHDPRITWKVQDVREVDVSGFDVILCLGLFYHLTLDDQLQLLAKCQGTPLIIDTHLDTGKPTHSLTEQLTLGGYTGRFYAEERQYATASWENDQSFWPTVDSFYEMLDLNGYSVILTVEPWYLSDRTFFLALPG